MSRPFILDPLFKALTTLPGIGPRNGAILEKLIGGPKIIDLLWHKPIELIDRTFSPPVNAAPEGKIVTLELTIDGHNAPPRSSMPFRVNASDDTGPITLTFFRANKPWIEKILPIGEKRIVSGKIDFYNGLPQIVHPDAIGALDERAEIETIQPVYPLSAGLTNKAVGKALHGALQFAPDIPEWLDKSLIKQQGWASWKAALEALHAPEGPASLLPDHPARTRLAYDELLANQITLAMVRKEQRKSGGRSYPASRTLRPKVIEALPFALTGAQSRSLTEIDQDMNEPAKMMRLLQGDVGSGKTIVAALSMLNAVEAGAQAALMAPTEILARQHEETLKPLLEPLGLTITTLTGRDKGKAREALLEQISTGQANIIIGTHAIFQDTITFHNLGLAVIDEQHRFGVHQRLALSSKGKGVDVLVMTATPIPRTLTLTAYGDMDVSRIDEKPPGRKPVETLLIPKDKMENMIDGLGRKIKDGARVYWVCPLVEESELINLAAAEERAEALQFHFGRVGLIHGKMKPAEKDEAMQRFANGELDILVATTVIEVGVNVPEATIMVIEHAERFGLSQLHQLRGRVGRGGDQSFCFMLYDGPLGETAKERLSVMRETEDGFVIAEKDLELRGAGDILGTKQSGLPQFRLADLEHHKPLLEMARDEATLILQKDETLTTDRGSALRTLLYLFERDQAIGYLKAG